MRSIIRRGNHFIYLEGCGWVLIDGPWFERLSGYVDKPYVLLYSLGPVAVAMIEESEPYPEMTETREVTWERVRWYPSSMYWEVSDIEHHEKLWISIIISYGVHKRRMGSKYCQWTRFPYLLRHMWGRYIRKHEKIGWRMLPDGVLPAYLCQPELSEDWMHSNYLMEHGY